MIDHLVQLELLDALPQIGPRPGPGRFLDDAVIHVRDVHRAVGRGAYVDRSKQQIGAQQKFGPGIRVAQLRQSFGLDDLRTAQDRLVQTEKLASLGQLTAGIAHEIKNPLNFVNNFAGVQQVDFHNIYLPIGILKNHSECFASLIYNRLKICVKGWFM